MSRPKTNSSKWLETFPHFFFPIYLLQSKLNGSPRRSSAEQGLEKLLRARSVRVQQPTNCGGVRCPDWPAPLPFSSPAQLITSSLCLFLLWAAGKEAKFISGPRPPNEPETRLHLENKHHDSCATRPQNSRPKYFTQLPGAFLLLPPPKEKALPSFPHEFLPISFFIFHFSEKKIKKKLSTRPVRATFIAPEASQRR